MLSIAVVLLMSELDVPLKALLLVLLPELLPLLAELAKPLVELLLLLLELLLSLPQEVLPVDVGDTQLLLSLQFLCLYHF